MKRSGEPKQGSDEEGPVPTGKPIWQVAAEIMEGVPQEELDRLPPDFSENFDHYLYGAPRKPRRSQPLP